MTTTEELLCPRPAVALGGARSVRPTVAEEAEAFLRQFYDECQVERGFAQRLARVEREIAATGVYHQTFRELEFGARVAWRNSRRCIGRLYWRSLRVVDRRNVTTAQGVFDALLDHLDSATNGGRLRPVATVFPAVAPGEDGIRIWNEQLIRYAGYRRADGTVVGDPRNLALTRAVVERGWTGATGGPHDLLPLVIQMPGEAPELFALPGDAVLEVPLVHPHLPWFADLGLRWHALPVIADMRLEIGGVSYPSAPFNGWYMGTEIGARNLGDVERYDLLPVVAGRMGLDMRTERSLWRDRALVELNVAVLHSFERAGVTITDHHTESRRFLLHIDNEERASRPVPAEWSWIVPPMSASATPVFHRYYDEDTELRPNFFRASEPPTCERPQPG